MSATSMREIVSYIDEDPLQSMHYERATEVADIFANNRDCARMEYEDQKYQFHKERLEQLINLTKDEILTAKNEDGMNIMHLRPYATRFFTALKHLGKGHIQERLATEKNPAGFNLYDILIIQCSWKFVDLIKNARGRRSDLNDFFVELSRVKSLLHPTSLRSLDTYCEELAKIWLTQASVHSNMSTLQLSLISPRVVNIKNRFGCTLFSQSLDVAARDNGSYFAKIFLHHALIYMPAQCEGLAWVNWEKMIKQTDFELLLILLAHPFFPTRFKKLITTFRPKQKKRLEKKAAAACNKHHRVGSESKDVEDAAMIRKKAFADADTFASDFFALVTFHCDGVLELKKLNESSGKEATQ